MPKLIFFMFFSLVLNISSAQTKNCLPLAGTYTINQTQPTANRNFNNFTDAVEALKCGGISDSVSFEVAAGEYSEAFIIPNIVGTSSKNTITFISDTRNADDVILCSDTIIKTDTINSVILIDSCEYLRFKYLSFKSDIVNLLNLKLLEFNKSNEIILEENKFEYLQESSERSDIVSFIVSQNILVQNNSFKCNDNSIYISGNSLISDENIEIINNSIEIFEYGTGISFIASNITIQNNLIFSNNSISATGLFFSTINSSDIIIADNYINLVSQTAIGIRFLGNSKILIANNFINIKTSYIGTSVSTLATNNVKILHNTFFLEAKGDDYHHASSFFKIFSGFSNNQIENNIFISTHANPIFSCDFSRLDNSNVIDNNCYYNNSLAFAHDMAINSGVHFNYWKEQTGFDANSIISNVNFGSETDLHLLAGQDFLKVNNPLPEITTDIDGDTRDNISPYYGADEFSEGLNFNYSDICFDNLTNFSINNTNNTQTVNWNFGDSQTSTQLEPSHIYTSAGIYTVTLTVTYSDNSTQIVNKEINITQKPQTPIISSQISAAEICSGSTQIYTVDNYKPELTYTWDIYNNSGNIQSITTNNSEIQITWDNSIGIDSLWLIADNNSCQSDTNKLIVKRISQPNALWENNKVCDGEDLQVNFSGKPPFKLAYFVNDNRKIIDNILENTHFINEGSGLYQLERVRDKNCLNLALSGNINAEIMTALPSLHLKDTKRNDTCCINSNSEYEINNYNSNSNYSWGIYGNTGTILDENNENILINWNNSLEKDSVWLVEQDEYSCKGDTLIQNIVKVNLPNVNFQDTAICYGEALKLNFSGFPPYSIEYLHNNRPSTKSGILEQELMLFHESGNYKLLEINDKYCTNSSLNTNNIAYIDVLLSELGFINFGLVDTVLLNELQTYLVTNKSENTLFYWEVTNGKIISENPSKTDSIVILWNTTGISKLSVYEETQTNCLGELTTIEILVIENEPDNDYQINLSIPNVFTPNGDGKNDYFTIGTDYSPENYVIFIKNRWGRKVFETHDINSNWDGMINGEYCSEGVYYYMIQYQNQGKRELKNGFVHLYRYK